MTKHGPNTHHKCISLYYNILTRRNGSRRTGNVGHQVVLCSRRDSRHRRHFHVSAVRGRGCGRWRRRAGRCWCRAVRYVVAARCRRVIWGRHGTARSSLHRRRGGRCCVCRERVHHERRGCCGRVRSTGTVVSATSISANDYVMILYNDRNNLRSYRWSHSKSHLKNELKPT